MPPGSSRQLHSSRLRKSGSPLRRAHSPFFSSDASFPPWAGTTGIPLPFSEVGRSSLESYRSSLPPRLKCHLLMRSSLTTLTPSLCPAHHPIWLSAQHSSPPEHSYLLTYFFYIATQWHVSPTKPETVPSAHNSGWPRAGAQQMFVDGLNNYVTGQLQNQGQKAVELPWAPVSPSVKWALRLHDGALFLLQCSECSSKRQKDLVSPLERFCPGHWVAARYSGREFLVAQCHLTSSAGFVDMGKRSKCVLDGLRCGRTPPLECKLQDSKDLGFYLFAYPKGWDQCPAHCSLHSY